MRVIRLVFFMRSIIASAVPSAGVGKPNDLRQDDREEQFRGATFWRGPDFLVVTARLRRGIGWTTSDCKHQSRGSDVGRGIATSPTKRSRVTRGNQPTGNTAACLSGLWQCGVGSELLF